MNARTRQSPPRTADPAMRRQAARAGGLPEGDVAVIERELRMARQPRGKIALALTTAALGHIAAALLVHLRKEAYEALVGAGAGCDFTPGDVEAPGNGVAVGVGRTQVADGAAVKVHAKGRKVGEGITREGDGSEARVVGGRSEAVVSSGESCCIVRHNNCFLK